MAQPANRHPQRRPEWRDVEVFRCEAGNYPLITSQKPDDLPAFDAALVDLFG